jgi:peptidoglycan/LPS O-acetylase OafA/YrhL
MRRIAELDGLRGLAAVTVVAYHIFMYHLPWGWAGVDVFFVLSGYLITAIALQNGGSWGFLPAFYARRGLRIWPIYYLLIMILALRGLDNVAALPYYLTYTQQVPCYRGYEMPPWLLMQHTWTLALEEQFYLIWPVLVLLAGRRWTGPLALTLAIGSVAARTAGVHWWLLAARSDGFALGGLLAAVLADSDVERARRRAQSWAAVLGALGVLLMVYLGAIGRLVDAGSASILGVHATVASLSTFALVAMLVCHAGHRVFAPLRMAPLVYLGTISYGIYL